MQINPDEITSILKSRIEGLDAGSAELTEVGTVLSVADGIARLHGLENCMSFEMLELPHGVTGLALNLESDNVGAVLFGEWEHIFEGDTVKRTGRCSRSPSARRCSGGSSTRSGARSTARARSDDRRAPPGRVQGARRRPAPAGHRTDADRPEGDRRDDPDRPRPARADHRRPPDRQDGDRDRHDHQQPDTGVVSVYVAIGQRMSTVVALAQTLDEHGALENTIIVAAPPTRRRRSSSWRPTPAARWPSTSSTTAGTRCACTTT